MKLNLTKKEYRTLIEMIYLSEWMMNAHAIDTKNKDMLHDALRKKILSHYKEMQAEDIIEFSKEHEDYYVIRSFEESIHEKIIEKYDEYQFWDTLIDKLAERDVVNELGVKDYLLMEGIERVMKVEEGREKFEKEFEKFGLDRVRIDQ